MGILANNRESLQHAGGPDLEVYYEYTVATHAALANVRRSLAMQYPDLHATPTQPVQPAENPLMRLQRTAADAVAQAGQEQLADDARQQIQEA